MSLCLAAAGSPAQDRGPETAAFGERSLALLDLPVFHFPPADPEPIERGETRWSLSAAYGSSFSKTWHAATVHRELGRAGRPFSREEAEFIHGRFPGDAVVFIDAELLRSAIRGRVGLTETLSVSAEVPVVSFSSFTWDSAVEGFHSALGISQAGRSAFARGGHSIVLQRPGREVHFSDRGARTRLGDVSLTLSWRAPPAGSLRFGADAAIKTPTGTRADLAGSGSWDAGLLLFARLPAGRWSIGAESALVVPGAWRSFRGISTAPFGRVLLLAHCPLGRRTGVGASVAYEQSALRENGLGDASRAGMEAAIGLEWRATPRVFARLTLIENIPGLGDRADVGLALSMHVR